jgi:hypothetical protein
MIARSLAAIFCLGLAFPRLGAAPVPADEPKHAAIDDATIAAYEKLGARYGGFIVSRDGWIEFEQGKDAAAKHLPGFRFRLPKEGNLPGPLPAVGVQFGLSFDWTLLAPR